MSGALTLQFTTQVQNDMRRISNQLTDLQGQMGSGARASDLQGFGGASSRLLNAQSLKATADSRASVLNQLQARFGVQGAALGQVADAAQLLAQSIREAISANDGRGITTELDLSFSSIVSALNETWNGQPLFAGERQNGRPVKVDTLDELMATSSSSEIFDEAARHQVVDVGAGAPIVVSAKASEMSQGLFDALKQLKTLLNSSGGTIGQPITPAAQDTLQYIAGLLDSEATNFTTEEGRAGQIQKRFEAELTNLQTRSDLLTKEIGDEADADIGEVSMKLSTLLAQYQAAAKTFSELSKLSLLDYL